MAMLTDQNGNPISGAGAWGYSNDTGDGVGGMMWNPIASNLDFTGLTYSGTGNPIGEAGMGNGNYENYTDASGTTYSLDPRNANNWANKIAPTPTTYDPKSLSTNWQGYNYFNTPATDTNSQQTYYIDPKTNKPVLWNSWDANSPFMYDMPNRPNGFDTFITENGWMIPLAMATAGAGAALSGGAAAAEGVGGLTAGSTSTGAGLTGAVGTGGGLAASSVPTLAGGLELGAASGLTGNAAVDAALASAGKGALTNAGMNSVNQLATTGSINPTKVLNAGLTGAVAGGVGSGLTSAGLPSSIANTVGGSAAGATGAALNGSNIGHGALVGGAGGAASGVANTAGKELGLDPISQGALSGAIRGGTMAGVNNGSIGTGALTGAAVGGASAAGGQIGNAISNGVTGDTGNTLLGQVLGSAAGSTANSLISSNTTPSTTYTTPGSSATSGSSTGSNSSQQSTLNQVMGSASPYASGTPSSGLGQGSGLPGSLGAGTLAMNNTADVTDALGQLKQLYPQLNSVDPRLLSSLASSPVTMKNGGIARMASGGSPESMQQFLNPPVVHETAAQQALYGNPIGGHRRALAPTYFINGHKKGGRTHIPEFITGTTGHYVKGKGDGQSDDIPAMLADGEYVFDADTVASLGNGSSDAGSKVLDKMREEIRKHKRSASAKEIPPKAKSPLEYMKGKA